MMPMLLILSIFLNVILASVCVKFHRDRKDAEEREWHVRRAIRRLRDGEPLVGDDRYIVRSLLGDRTVDAILSSKIKMVGACHD